MSALGVYKKKEGIHVVGVPLVIVLKDYFIQGRVDHTFPKIYIAPTSKKEPWMKDYDKIVEKELMTWQ